MKDEPFTRRFVSARCLTQSLLCAKSRAEIEISVKQDLTKEMMAKMLQFIKEMLFSVIYDKMKSEMISFYYIGENSR